MRRPLMLEEYTALYSLFQHPGMKVLQRQLKDYIEDTLMSDLRKGGVDAHERNVGRMIGVEGVLNLLDQLKDESIAKTKEL